MTDAADDNRAAEHPEPLEGEQVLSDPVRQLGAYNPATDAQRGEIRFVTKALDKLERVAEQHPWVEIPWVENRLGVEVYDGGFLTKLADRRSGRLSINGFPVRIWFKPAIGTFAVGGSGTYPLDRAGRLAVSDA
jgi:hypothetical protein